MEEKSLGKIIKEARKSKNKTLKEVADEVGIDTSTLHKYESGTIKTIPYDKLEKISLATTGSSYTILNAMSGAFGLGGVLGTAAATILGGVTSVTENLIFTDGFNSKNSTSKKDIKEKMEEIKIEYCNLINKVDELKFLFNDSKLTQEMKDQIFTELRDTFRSLEEEYFKNKYKK